MKNDTQNVLCSNFFENKYFFSNPKAKVAPTPLLSKTPQNMPNGPKLEKLFHFFVRGCINQVDTVQYRYIESDRLFLIPRVSFAVDRKAPSARLYFIQIGRRKIDTATGDIFSAAGDFFSTASDFLAPAAPERFKSLL